MTRLVSIALAATIAGAPSLALAASPRHHHHGRHAARIHHPNGTPAVTPSVTTPYGISQPVYRNGYYLGADPDPNVRFELWRDPPFGRR